MDRKKRIFTKEHIEKIRLSKLGKKRKPFSKQWRENLSKACQKEKNPNYKDGRCFKEKVCPICRTKFIKRYAKSCSFECGNILKKINAKKTNLGKTKYNTPHLMKLSLIRKGKKRNSIICKNISIATKKAMWNETVRKNYLKGSKLRNIDFFKSKEWRLKCINAKKLNQKNGKFFYNKIMMRSNWEIRFAKLLDKNNIKWEYENEIFYSPLTKKHYIPDFFIPEWNTYIEIKGYLTDSFLIKFNDVKNNYKDDSFILIYPNEFKVLCGEINV